MDDAPLFDMRDVVLRRNGRAILERVSWTVRRGEHWAVVGANGSGKTTLLEVLTGYEWPSSGTVEALGRRFGETDIPALRRRISWMSTAVEREIRPAMRLGEVVLSGHDASLDIYHAFPPEATRRRDRLLSEWGLADAAQTRFAHASHGERCRALIARAFMVEPDLVVLDEPFAGLDIAARERALRAADAVAAHERSPGLVLVTHHVEEIPPCVTHALALKRGRVVAAGPVRETLDSETLSDVFDIPVEVEIRDDRFLPRVRG